MDALLSANHVDHVQRDSFAPPVKAHVLRLAGQRKLATNAQDARDSLLAVAVIILAA